ncbi:MAG: hypothetical protein QXK52_07350 [Candidatus Bathyarchaeia archaeon]
MSCGKRFRNISLKAELIGEVEGYISKSRRYRSIADFVSEAIRRRLEELEAHGTIQAEAEKESAEGEGERTRGSW